MTQPAWADTARWPNGRYATLRKRLWDVSHGELVGETLAVISDYSETLEKGTVVFRTGEEMDKPAAALIMWLPPRSEPVYAWIKAADMC